MKDLLGREVQVGNYICYALTAGRSANLAVYQVKEVLDDKIKAVKIDSSYGTNNFEVPVIEGGKYTRRYTVFEYVPSGGSYFRKMTPEEKFKVDNKTSTLSMPERIFILDGFTPEVFEGRYAQNNQ